MHVRTLLRQQSHEHVTRNMRLQSHEDVNCPVSLKFVRAAALAMRGESPNRAAAADRNHLEQAMFLDSLPGLKERIGRRS